MKLKKILWIIPVILLISFISTIYVNGEDVDYSKINEKVVQEIEKTGLGFYFNKLDEMGKYGNYSLLWFINPNSDTFNTLGITYYEIDPKIESRVSYELQEEISIEGNKVVFQRYRENSDSLVQIKWYSEPFYITIGADSKRTKNTYDEMLKIVPIVTNALKQTGVHSNNTSNDEEIEQSQDYNIKIDLEKNPLTENAFKGIVADGTSSLQIEVNIPDGYKGKIKIKTPKVGSFEGVKIEQDIKPSGDISFTYLPPQYTSNQTDNKEKFISEEIIITYTLEDGTTKEIKESIQVYKPPVVLVHGFTGDKTTWQELDTVLQARGFDTVREEYYYNDATGQSIPAQAHGLSRHIKDKIAEYHSLNIKINKVDVVAHSMGGLISRYYISKLDNLYQDDIRKLIMVGTPNHGSNYLEKIAGWKISEDLNKHKKAAEQLYGNNPFILDLNEGESEGKHLDPDVQYGIIYGSGSPIGGDGVVAETSALLNGVIAENFPGRTHSPSVSFWGTSLTLDKEVFSKVLSWLESDIPSGEFTNIDMRIYSVEGEAYISNLDYTNESNYWRNLDDSSTEKIYAFDDIKTGDGRLVILLKAGSEIFGYVEMDKNTELYFEYASPKIVRVNLSKGSAKFASNSKAGKHFETVIKASNNIQIVRGLNTQFVVSLSDKPTVYSLEGKVELINAASVDRINTEIIEENNGAVFEESGSFTASEPNADPWWENEFYKPISFGNNIIYIIFGSWKDDIKQVSTIDLILLGIVAVSGIYGYRSGFISTLFSFLSYFLAIIGARLLAPKAVSLLASKTTFTSQIDALVMIRSDYILTAISMVLIFILLKIIISNIGKLLNNRIKLSLAAKVNKTLGLVLGTLTGFMIIAIGLLVVIPLALASSNGTLAEIIDNSLIIEKLLQIIGF